MTGHPMTSRTILWRTFLYLCLAAATLVALFPLFWMVSSALRPEGQILAYPPRWLPATWTLENFAYILGRFAFARWWVNSIVVAGVSTALVLLLDSLAAYAFARLHFAGQRVLYIVVLSMLLVPIQVTIIPLYMLFAQVHLLDSLPAVLLPTTANVTGVFLLTQFFRNLPGELLDAARIDGASDLRIWWHIVLPVSRPVLSSVAIITVVSSWNSFLWPLLVAYSDASRTLPVGIAQFFGGESGVSGSAPQFGPAMAAACLATAPVIVAFLVLQRSFVRGVALSGLKG